LWVVFGVWAFLIKSKNISQTPQIDKTGKISQKHIGNLVKIHLSRLRKKIKIKIKPTSQEQERK
jgi:hypothetical protein